MAKYRLFLLVALLYGFATLHAQQADSIKVKVYFALDKYNISPEAKKTLDAFIKNHREITWINIEAFTDSRASVAYNDVLAMNRAKSVQNYLLNNGLAKTTETHINAFGKRKQLDLGTSEAAHQNNRVVILTCYVVPPVINKPTLRPAKADTVKTVPPSPPPPAAKKDTVKVDVPEAKPAPGTTQKQEVIKASPIVTSSPADTIKTPPAADTLRPAIEVKETVPTGEVDRGLEQRILEVIKHAKVGESFVLHTIYFMEGRHVFVKDATSPLQAVLAVMKARPALELEIQGHVCCTDSLAEDALDFDTHLFNLSYARAQAVADYMVKNGIARERVQSLVGFGSRRRIVYPEKTLADRNRNRRVEFKILKK
ncbi:MAG TPA: OmpA family protein [Chitinophagaceae bacterium]|nr:OmpA family protein [Chitinophagaceae bacterium]